MKPSDIKRRPKARAKKWTDAEEALMRSQFPHMRTADLAAKLKRKYANVASKAAIMGLRKSDEFLATKAHRFTDGEIGRRTRFTPGHSSWNKGKKGIHTGGEATQFKKGAVPPNHRPVGSTRINVEGYIEIKVAEGKFQWRALHRENWKAAHGEYPSKGFGLVFRDGNKQNCAIDNLELISRADLMQRNTIHRYPPALKETIKLAAKVRRKLDEHDRHE